MVSGSLVHRTFPQLSGVQDLNWGVQGIRYSGRESREKEMGTRGLYGGGLCRAGCAAAILAATWAARRKARLEAAQEDAGLFSGSEGPLGF